MACPFLEKAPLEIRNEIYSYLLSVKYTRRRVRDDERILRAKQGLEGCRLYDFQPAILRTNKRINSEARRFLYDDNLFVLVRCTHIYSVHMLRIAGLTPIAVKKDEVRCFRSSLRISLHVDLTTDENEESPVESRFVIAASELWMLCKILNSLDNRRPGFLSSLNVMLGIFPCHQLGVDASVMTELFSPLVWNSRPLPQQRMLLQPFGTLHSIKDLKIASVDGKAERIDTQLVQYVKEKAGRLAPSREEILVTTTKIKEQGNEAFRAGNFRLACSLYKSACENLDAGTRYLQNPSRTSDFMKDLGEHIQLWLRIRSNTVAALLCLQQWSKAHKKATQVIRELTFVTASREEVYSPVELAKLHYRRALASEGMGQRAQAVDQVGKALHLDPSNMEMKARLKNWNLQTKDTESTKQAQAALNALTDVM